MPNSKTFEIPAVKDLIIKYNFGGKCVDPFANEHSIQNKLVNIIYTSNDLDKSYKCDYNLEAQKFMKLFKDNTIDLILYDPPYSPRQVKEMYNNLNKTVTKKDTQSDYWQKFKKEIKRILKVGGICISFGWDSNGIGKSNGFEIIEILLVAHGGAHNDTICTVETKKHYQEKLFGDD